MHNKNNGCSLGVLVLLRIVVLGTSQKHSIVNREDARQPAQRKLLKFTKKRNEISIHCLYERNIGLTVLYRREEGRGGWDTRRKPIQAYSTAILQHGLYIDSLTFLNQSPVLGCWILRLGLS